MGVSPTTQSFASASSSWLDGECRYLDADAECRVHACSRESMRHNRVVLNTDLRRTDVASRLASRT